MLKYLDNHSGERSEKDTFKIHKLLLPTMIEEKDGLNLSQKINIFDKRVYRH